MLYEFLVRDRINEAYREAKKSALDRKCKKAKTRTLTTFSKYYLLLVWVDFHLLNDYSQV